MKEFLAIPSLGSFINNQFVANPTQKPVSLKSSVTEKDWKQLYFASEQQINEAITLSEKAFLSFREKTAYERGSVLKKAGSFLIWNDWIK